MHADLLAHGKVILGHLAQKQKQWTEAIAFYRECLDIRRRIGDRRAGYAYVYMAAACRHDFASAFELCKQGLTVCAAIGNQWGLALALELLSILYRQQGDEYCELAAKTGGMAETLRDEVGATRSPLANVWSATERDQAHDYLKREFRKSWNEGATMSLEQSLEWIDGVVKSETTVATGR
jgi:hypothetical protein